MRTLPKAVAIAILFFFWVGFGVRSAASAGTPYLSFGLVGDSISAGWNSEGLTSGDGWVDLLFGDSITGVASSADTIARLWPGIETQNEAVSGSTASEWSAPGFGPMGVLLARSPDLVVVFIGGNDLIGYMENEK